MHLGRDAVTASVTATSKPTSAALLPKDFCSPQCPSCRADYLEYNEATSCVANSSFITNCGSCQICILTFQIENPAVPNLSLFTSAITDVLDRCLNTSASDAIVALQSQASRISLIGVELTSGETATPTPHSFTRTGSLTWTGTINPSWTSILSTATWASAYYSWKSAESVASAAAASVAGKYNLTAVGEGPTSHLITPAPTGPITTAAAQSPLQPLNMTWVVGPVIGSILGMVTVFVVIYFTRRKQRLEAMALEEAARNVKDEEDDSGESVEGKAQLHSESVVVRELENNEVHEMAAVEPVGSELNSPRDTAADPLEDWPLPLSPLPLLFAMSEMRDLRDERAGNNNSPKHSTYYNP